MTTAPGTILYRGSRDELNEMCRVKDDRIGELEAACRVALDAYSQVSSVRIPGAAAGALVHARETLRRALGQL